jgi:GNAT superfamily N-acetyltransferase
MNKDELVIVRPTVEADKNFIMATILRGLFYGESWFSEIDKSVFMENYHRVIDFLLAKDTTEVRIACLKEDPEVILGYSIVSPSSNLIHFVFVKKAWRGIGIASMLVPTTTTTATQLTKTGLAIIRKKSIDFNPFLL